MSFMPYTISVGTVPDRIQVPMSAPTASRMKIGTIASEMPCTRPSWMVFQDRPLYSPTSAATPLASISVIWFAPYEELSLNRNTPSASAAARKTRGVSACSRLGSRDDGDAPGNDTAGQAFPTRSLLLRYPYTM
jgi:hypothetical protein